jgi:RNA-directed DNA polymerase
MESGAICCVKPSAPLDHLMAERGFEMVRYADDFVVICRTLEEATAALALVKALH